MKDEIKKHEWGYTVSPISTPKLRCCHCEVDKIENMITGSILYIDKYGNPMIEEPPCITRKISNYVEGNKE